MPLHKTFSTYIIIPRLRFIGMPFNHTVSGRAIVSPAMWAVGRNLQGPRLGVSVRGDCKVAIGKECYAGIGGSRVCEESGKTILEKSATRALEGVCEEIYIYWVPECLKKIKFRVKRPGVEFKVWPPLRPVTD